MVEPADLRLRVEDERVEDQAPGQVGRLLRRCGATAALEPGVVLQRGHGGAALALDDRADVDTGQRHRDGELDRELVTGGLGARHRGGEPCRHLAPSGLGGAVDVRAVRCERLADTPVPGELAPDLGRDDLDHAVPLEARQGRVDLTDVERPGLPRALLELRAELVAVHRPLLQDRQHGLTDRHPRLRGRSIGPRDHGYRVCIPRMYDPRTRGLALRWATSCAQRPSDRRHGQHHERTLLGRQPATSRTTQLQP